MSSKQTPKRDRTYADFDEAVVRYLRSLAIRIMTQQGVQKGSIVELADAAVGEVWVVFNNKFGLVDVSEKLLRGVLRNKIRELLRKKFGRTFQVWDENAHGESDDTWCDEPEELNRAIMDCLSPLTPGDRLIFHYRIFDEWSNDKVANKLNRSKHSTSRSFSRIRTKMADCLRRKGFGH